jgi:hypothetical protein
MHPPARTVCAALVSATRTLGIEGVRPYRRSRRSSASERALVHGDTELYDPFDGRAAAGVEVAASAPGLAVVTAKKRSESSARRACRKAEQRNHQPHSHFQK